MALFLWVMIALLALSAVAKVTWLVTSQYPLRKPAGEATDVVVNAALIAWAAVLLTRV